MGRVTRILAALFAALALSACAAAPEPSPSPTPLASTVTAAPDDGVLLGDLRFDNAPAGLSIPRGSVIAERIDSPNNVTVVLTAPDGLTVVDYLRRTLPEVGFTITGDDQNSLLFDGGGWQGAFTTSDGYSALTLRTDRA